MDCTGFSEDEVRGWNWKDTNILDPDDLTQFLAAWQTIVVSGKQGEFRRGCAGSTVSIDVSLPCRPLYGADERVERDIDLTEGVSYKRQFA